ncbi:MAG: hypothetical protein MUO39_06420 [Steroidobacteraceae bacterium]|nr:hypothetical protein [Steroidobacteraceae bacterium]
MNAWKRIALTCLSLLVLGLAPIGAAFAQVKVTAATPSSAYQGTTSLEVVVSGSGFDKTAKADYFVSGTTNPGGITVRNVVFRNSRELVTTIDVVGTAAVANFDIQVTLSSGRKGKGTTLFSVKAKPAGPPKPPLPTYPAARAWHSFTANGGSDVATSRLYMYGGAGADWQVVPADLWYYGAWADKWTLVTPSSTTNPGNRQWAGLSCGASACVMATGSNGFGFVDETWVYSEATNAWTKAVCGKRSPCPAPRMMTTMAFDPDRGNHLLFGGLGSSAGLNDTLTFDTATLKWRFWNPTLKPSERNRAAAVHVPGVGVVMHGGQDYRGRAALCDLFAWNGSNWTRIDFDAAQPHPCLHTHSIAWDGQGLIVTGGYVDTSDTPSPSDWRFTFAADHRSGTWAMTTRGTCQPIDGTDADIHPGAKMAYDSPTASRVYFGGEENIDQVVVRYDNTVECQ